MFHRLNYDGKSRILDSADLILTPARYVFGGKTVDCYRLDEEEAAFFESRPSESGGQSSALKVASVVLSILGAPMLIGAYGIKHFDEKHKGVLKRYLDRSESDAYLFRPRIGDSLISRTAVRLFMRTAKLDQVAAAMQIQGQKIIKAFSPGKYDGGLPLPIAEVIKEKLIPYTNEPTDFSEACRRSFTALKSLDSTSRKMIPLMLARLFHVSWLLDPSSYKSDLAKDIKDDLLRLQDHEPYLIPLTFFCPSKGYRTVITSLAPDGKGAFEWKIYRAHVGSEGVVTNKWFANNRVPGIRLKHLTPEQATDLSFLNALIDFGTFAERDQGERFFTYVTNFEKKHDNVTFSSRMPTIKTPEADLDTIRSVNFVMKDLMGKRFYKEFKLLMRVDSLIELKKTLDSSSALNPEQLSDASSLFDKAKNSLKRFVTKAGDLLSDEQKAILS